MMRPPFPTDLYLKALRFAAAAHGNQKVPGSDLPYLLHVCSVAAEVIGALDADEKALAEIAIPCALLHDTAEDTAVGIERIESEFGAAVAAGVDALSKRPTLAKEDQMADSLERIQRQPVEVWMVKLADRITNLQPPPAHWTPERCHAYRIEAERILSALGSASPWLAARFRERIADYRRFEGPPT